MPARENKIFTKMVIKIRFKVQIPTNFNLIIDQVNSMGFPNQFLSIKGLVKSLSLINFFLRLFFN